MFLLALNELTVNAFTDQLATLDAATLGEQALTPDDDFETVQQFELLVQRAQNRLDWCRGSSDRKHAEDRWTDAQNFWLGKQWDGIKSFNIPGRTADERDLHANPVDNYVKAFVEGVVGDITDRPADIQIKGRGNEDETFAQTYSAVSQYLWYANRGDRNLEFAVRRGVLHGPLIAKVYWDPDFSPGDSPTSAFASSNPFPGDVRFFNVLPTNLFVDPRVRATEEGVIQDAEFVIYGVRRSLTYIKEYYPERGHLVKADTYADYVTTLTKEEDDSSGTEFDDNQTLLIEYWYKGPPMAPEFPSLNEPPEFRPGWVHKAVIAGGVLLEHRTYVYPWFPFVMEWMYPSDESIHGYGDAYDILVPQLVINKLTEISIEGAALQSFGNWLTENGNITNKDQFQRYASMGRAVLPVGDVGRTQRIFGGNVPASLFTHYRQALQTMETLIGRHDVAQGRTPRNVQAASAIALLLQQAGGRVRQRARAVASYVEQIIRMSLELVALHYTDERIVRIQGTDGNYSQFTVKPSNLLKSRPVTNLETGEVTDEQFMPGYDVIVTAGAETPTSKAYYSELAMQLFKMGLVDDVGLLDTLQFPKWREILARKQAKEQLMQMLQQLLAKLGGSQMPAQQPPPAAPGQAPVPPELSAMQGAEAMQANPFGQIGGAAPQQGQPTEQELMQLVALLQASGLQ